MRKVKGLAVIAGLLITVLLANMIGFAATEEVNKTELLSEEYLLEVGLADVI